MKKFICFLLLTFACTTSAQTLSFNGDDTFGTIRVEIIINGGTPINLGFLSKNLGLSYTIPSNIVVNSLEIIAEGGGAYVYVEPNDNYYQLYLDYLFETGTYFDNPESSYLYVPDMDVSNFFIGTFPVGYIHP